MATVSEASILLIDYSSDEEGQIKDEEVENNGLQENG